MACLAYRDSYWHPCRNWATLETLPDGSQVRSHTCKQHADFFDSTGVSCRFRRQWFGPELPGIHLRRRRIYRLEYHPTVRKCIERILQHGLVLVKKEDILSLTLTPDHDEEDIGNTLCCFYSLCSAYVPGFDSTWCPPGAWSFAVRRLWKLAESLGPWDCTQDTVFEMICVPGRPRDFLHGLLAYLFDDEHHTIRTASEWYVVLERMQRFDPEFFLEWISSNLLCNLETCFNTPESKKVLQKNPLFQDLDAFEAWRVSKIESWKESRKRVLEPVKEELMAATWHPDRMQIWCLDEETKAEMRLRWSDFRG